MDFIKCYDCSPGLEGNSYSHIGCQSLITDETCHNYHKENWISMNNPNNVNQIMCADCSPGLNGTDYVSGEYCNSIVNVESCINNNPNSVFHETRTGDGRLHATWFACSPGLGDENTDPQPVPESYCSTVITNDNCPENNVAITNGQYIQCYDCSPGFQGQLVPSECSAILTQDTCATTAGEMFNLY